jgi:hypothetical protein
LLIDFKMPFVFSRVTPLMALCQDSPDYGIQTQRMRYRLKDYISILRAIAVPPQGSERKRVCGVVRQIKSALEGELLVASIG